MIEFPGYRIYRDKKVFERQKEFSIRKFIKILMILFL